MAMSLSGLCRKLLALAVVIAGICVSSPYQLLLVPACIFLGLVLWLKKTRSVVVRFGRLTWTQGELCRHFLITGDTGCGKTTSGFHPILVQITRSVPNWGGLVLGVKGDEHAFMTELAEAHGRTHDLVHIQVRPEEESTHWRPPNRYNLIGDRTLPWSTHAKAVVDTASSLTEGRQSVFFKPMAQIALSNAFQLLDELVHPVTLTRAYGLLTVPDKLQEAMEELGKRVVTDRRHALMQFFTTTFLSASAPEQREGIEGTIKTYLGFFMDTDIANVFSSDEPNTFSMEDVDHGAIISVGMPQRFVTERRYVQTYLKMLFYYHALRRFELRSECRHSNLLLLVADEFQDIVTASEDGISDHKIIDRVRAANLAILAGMQSEVSADPAIGKDKRRVLSLNFRSRLIFRAADLEGATASADFIGKRTVWKRSRTARAFGATAYSKREQEEHKILPAKLMELRDRWAFVVHPTKRFCRSFLRPVNGRGKIPSWYKH